MPIYGYECDGGHVYEEYRPIKDGPRKDIICGKCREKMYLQLSCNFVLKGDGWPGKEINKDQTLGALADKAGQFCEEHDNKKKDSKEVLKQRRKGKKHFKEWRQHNKPIVERYEKNLSEGIKGRHA